MISQLAINDGLHLNICNLEGALTDSPERCNKIGPIITAPTKAIEAYKKLGVDCCMLANNHITDGGHQGVIDTINTLDNANIKHIGAGISANEIKREITFELGEITIGLYNVCELMYNRPTHNKGGAWLYDEYIVCKEIADLKSRCDYLIVIYHGGIERFRYPSPENRKRFHRMVDNGADMILSQHTHCIGCEEWYKGAYLLYGQGNFLFRNLRPGQTDEAIIIEIRLLNGKPSVVKHLVKCVEDMFVRYNERQDLTAFNKRSVDIKNDDFIQISEVEKKVNQTFEISISEERLNEEYEKIKVIFPTLDEDVIKLSVKKNRGNTEDTIMYLTEETNINNLKKEIEENKKKEKMELKKKAKKEEENIIPFEEDKINLLFEILNQEDDLINEEIWKLLGSIKYPDNIINTAISEELMNVISEPNLYKMLLNLKLVNSLVFDDKFCKFNKIAIEKKLNWTSNFMKNESFVNSILTKMNKIGEISLRLYFLVIMFLIKLQLWAQNDDNNIVGSRGRGREDDLYDMEGLMEYQPFRIRTSDIIMLVLLLIACYVFGKIWKGCTYLLLAFAALMYYMLRF